MKGGEGNGCDRSQQRHVFSIFESNSSHGILMGESDILNCTIYNNTGASTDGVNNGTGLSNIFNTISVNNGRYGFNMTAYATDMFDYNCYNGNGTGGINGISAGTNDVSSSPNLVDPANGNFRYRHYSNYNVCRHR